MRNAISNPRGYFMILLAALSLFTACNRPWSEQFAPDGNLLTSDERDRERVDSLLRAMSTGPGLKDCELEQIDTAFDDHVFSNNTGTPLPRRSVKLLRSEFEDKFDFAVPSRTLPMVAIRYGLDFSGYVTYGIGFCWIGFDDHKVTPPRTYYEVLGTGKFSDAMDTTTWNSTYGSAYTNGTTVHIRRTEAGTPTPFHYDTDTRMVLLDAIRIRQFLMDNSTADILELVSYADIKPGDIYHHGVTIVPWIGHVRQLDHVSHGDDVFRNRALNLGSPCPENCAQYRERYDRRELKCP